jgi:hypothetical protein
MPLYSVGTKDLTGEMNLAYTKYSQSSKFHKFTLSIDAKQYLYDYDKEYTRIMPQLNIELQKSSLQSKKHKYISASYIYLDKQEETLDFLKGKFVYANRRTLNPYSLYTLIEQGEEFSKIHLGGNLRKNLSQKKSLNIRGYFGYVNTTNDKYNLTMSAWNGSDDYMFSERAFSRSKSSAHNLPYQQQIFIKEGGLKHFTNDSLNSSQWLSSLYVDYNLFEFLRPYTEGGTNGTDFAYGSGFSIPFLISGPGFNGGLQLYVPLITEEGIVDFKDYKNVLRFNAYLSILTF